MKSPSIPKTRTEQFRTVMVGFEAKKLFSVNAELPVCDVLQEAACILDTAQGVIREGPATGLEEATTYALSNLLEQTAACLEAILNSPDLDSLEVPLTNREEQCEPA